jgi:SAM-dependent methyltransferase
MDDVRDHQELRDLLELMVNEDLEQIVLSDTVSSEIGTKVKIRPVLLKDGLYFQFSKYSGKQIFHTNLRKAETIDRIDSYLSGWFRQAQLRSSQYSAIVLVSKKGRQSIKKRLIRQEGQDREGQNQDRQEHERLYQEEYTIEGKDHEWQNQERHDRNRQSQDTQNQNRIASLSHNRIKHYILEDGVPVNFLVDLGVQTPQGKVVKAKYDKFRQINRYLEFVRDIREELPKDRTIRIMDFGCGKSYLTFALYHYLHELCGLDVDITGLDLKEDVIRKCQELADRYQYAGLHFEKGDIGSCKTNDSIDMVVSLHACDTATDYALEKAVKLGAKVIFAVPCCQKELNRQMHAGVLEPILKFGILRERFAALLTDGLRAGLLEEQGYQVQVLEFIQMEHTPKNLLIRGIKKDGMQYGRRMAEYEKQVESIMELFQVSPTLKRLIHDNKNVEYSADLGSYPQNEHDPFESVPML